MHSCLRILQLIPLEEDSNFARPIDRSRRARILSDGRSRGTRSRHDPAHRNHPPPPRQSISPDIALLRIAVILRSPARSCYRVSRRVSRRIGRLVADPHSGRRCTLLYNKPNSIAGDTASSEAFPRSSTAAVQRPIKIA